MTGLTPAGTSRLTGRLVRLYFDSTRRTWSLTDPKSPSRKLLGKGPEVVLEGCRMMVSESRRQWVIRNKRKIPHAFVEGVVVGRNKYDFKTGRAAAFTYSPFHPCGTFRTVDGDRTLTSAVVCHFTVTADGHPVCLAYGSFSLPSEKV